jgi:PEP-CTERM putative exosortase interaction domain
MRHKYPLLLSAAALVAASPHLSAASYTGSAYDGFDYTAGTAINIANALNGGVGWNASGNASPNTTVWGAPIPNNNSGNGISVGTGSLAYANLLTSGGHAVVNGSTTTAIGRSFGQNINSGTFYFSFLIAKTVETERTLNVSFFSDADGTGSPTERFAIGQIGGGANDSDGNFALLVSNSGADNGLKLATTPISLGLNQTHLVVGRLDFNINDNIDRLSFYIDPALGAEPGSAYMTFETDFQVLRGFRMFAGNASGDFTPAAQGVFDEFRFGTSWESVAVVPEPSAFALMGLGLLALIGRRRH